MCIKCLAQGLALGTATPWVLTPLLMKHNWGLPWGPHWWWKWECALKRALLSVRRVQYRSVNEQPMFGKRLNSVMSWRNVGKLLLGTSSLSFVKSSLLALWMACFICIYIQGVSKSKKEVVDLAQFTGLSFTKLKPFSWFLTWGVGGRADSGVCRSLDLGFQQGEHEGKRHGN